jgi:hypothetical protein
VIARIEELLKYETAGDPMTGLKWTRKTMDKIAQELRGLGISVSANTVARLLKQMDYSLRVNRKEIAFRCSADRNEQIVYLTKMRKRFAKQGNPTVSVDTKKKELVGRFKNAGAILSREPILVNDHDFRSTAVGMAIPYGIYDTGANRGMVFIGTSHDTPAFAVDSIGRWWSTEGRRRYPGADHLLILADGGGSNGPNCRAWKEGIQRGLCDRYGISVTVNHYPTGASKWNPVEHRLFSEISKNWAGHPLDSYETILKYIRTTKTEKGLKVRAYLVTKKYETGVTISDQQMHELHLRKHKALQRWDYTLAPTKM